MNEPNLQEEEIFKLALKIKPAQARETYLKQVCGENHALFDRLMTLLQAHDEESSFLEKPLSDAIVTEIGPVTEQPGDRIGPFKLLQQIGEGGFGVVYMAEQAKPVRRKVALKIIKPGMDSKEVIARFEAERQALALMDHPNIAKVLDAGSTESGRPYFVMELVKGVPLTEYCDKNHLTGTDRLKLFVKVCHAIQHAHQKGVIHRDLKPTNIMVTLHDGKPVPKVIDFGVSKALSQQLTEKTLFTAYGQMVGTPAYMSPEQAEMSGLDIDTRSDVYSLGVLLYELLTGSTPFDGKRLRSAGYAEMQRIIREEEPPKPSTRVTTLGEQAGIVSNARGTDPKKLGQLIRGELDWIVMKALDKERNRRYETANGFAADIERFLANEPVEACPPSTAYRFRKFARRNKAAFVATTAAVLVLLAVSIGSTIAAKQFRDLAEANAKLVVEKDDALKVAVDAETKAKRAQKDAEEARDEQKNLRIKAEQQRERATANYALARSAVDQFLNSVTHNELLSVPGMHTLREELLTSALDFYNRFAEDDSNAEEMKHELAVTYLRIGEIRDEFDQDDTRPAAYLQAQQLYQELLEGGDVRPAIRLGLALTHFRLREHQQCIELCEQVLAQDPEHLGAIELLGTTYNEMGAETVNQLRSTAALDYYRQSLKYRQMLFDKFPEKPDYIAKLGATINNIGTMLADMNKANEALDMFERSNGYLAKAYLKSPQNITWGTWLCNSLRNTALELERKRDSEGALQYLEEVVEIRRRLMIQNQSIPRLRGQLVFALKELGDHQKSLQLADEANRSHRAALELLKSVPRDTPKAIMDLAIVYGSLATPPQGLQGEPSTEWQSDQKYYAEQAFNLVREAFDKGFRDVTVLGHPALMILAQREDYQELVLVRTQEQIAEEILDGKLNTDEMNIDQLSRAEEILLKYSKRVTDPLEHQKTMAVLHAAIGIIQLSLSDFESAEQTFDEVIAQYQELRRKYPHDQEIEVRSMAARVSQGEFFWKAGRHADAHLQFQAVLNALAKSSKISDLNPEFDDRIYRIERKICWLYGGIGLWELALVHAERNVQYNRTESLVWDSRFSPVLLQESTVEEYKKFCQIYYKKFKTTESRLADDWLGKSHLNYTCGLIENAGVPIEERIALAERALELQPENRWVWFCNALTYYRAGQYQKALEINPYPDSGSLRHGVAYLNTLIQFQLGKEEIAKQTLEESDQEFLAYCYSPIDESSRKLTGPYSEWWNEFPTTHVLRAEAHRTIRGVTPPKTDLHLVQARAYHTVGELELAEREIQSAVESSPELAGVWFLQAQHFALKKDITKADKSWKRAVEIAGDHPELLLERAEYYAKTGRWDLAKADALRAVEIAPDQTKTVYDYCLTAERWQEAAKFGWKLIEQDPDKSHVWQNVAPAMVLAGDRDQYREFCERFLAQFPGDQEITVLSRLCLSCLLTPDSVDVSKVPGQELANRLQQRLYPNADYQKWAWSNLALWAYRTGDFDLVLECVREAEQHNPSAVSHARCQGLTALVQYQLKNEEEARRALSEMSEIVSSFSESDRTNISKLFTIILFQEAEAKINGKVASPSSKTTEIHPQ